MSGIVRIENKPHSEAQGIEWKDFARNKGHRKNLYEYECSVLRFCASNSYNFVHPFLHLCI